MFDNFKEIISILTTEEKKKFLVLLASSILMGLFQAISVVSLMPFIEVVLDTTAIHEPGYLNTLYTIIGFTDDYAFIVLLGFLILGLILASGVISSFTIWRQYKFVWGNNHSISRRLLANYLDKDYEFFLSRSTSEFTKNILDEANMFTRDYLLSFVNLIVGIAVSSAVVIMLVLVNPVITSIGILFLGGVYALIYTFFRKRLKNLGGKRLMYNEKRFKAVNEAFGGIKDVKLLGNERYFLQNYETSSKTYTDLVAKGALVGVLPRYLFETFAFGGMVAMTLFLLMKGGDVDNAIPLIAVFAFAAYRLMPQMQIIYNAITQMKFNRATIENIKHELEGSKERVERIMEDDFDFKPLRFSNNIELVDISYKHPNNENYTIKNLNLIVKKKEAVGIVGPTGAGKTTLVDIILGLLIPQKGSIRIDSVELNSTNLRNWQRNLGYVPQFIYLSDDTVTRNIAFGVDDDEIDIEMVKRAAKIARINDFVENELPRGYETIVGERGIRLSGGQRQRIGIARALYRDPDVLILDEATSSLDGITEREFTCALSDLSGVKTLIVIAHRFNTIKECNNIYFMERGRIIAHGTYDELLENNEQFRRMAYHN